jgi:hypothetical protein
MVDRILGECNCPSVCRNYQTGPPLVVSVYMSALLHFDPAPSTTSISCVFLLLCSISLDMHILCNTGEYPTVLSWRIGNRRSSSRFRSASRSWSRIACFASWDKTMYSACVVGKATVVWLQNVHAKGRPKSRETYLVGLLVFRCLHSRHLHS